MTEARDTLDVLAGEYVLGTLDEAERTAFAARLTTDEAARAAVLAWRSRLDVLLLEGEGIAPPASAWPAIEAQIGRSAANDNRVSPIWRLVAVAASVLAVVGGVGALRPVAPPAPAPRIAAMPGYVAAVSSTGTQPALLVTIDARTGKAVVRTLALAAPAAKALELWYIGDGEAPRSMGFIAGDERREMAMPVPGRAIDTGMFAVTAEPAGKVAGGAPTGAILYSGKPMAITGA